MSDSSHASRATHFLDRHPEIRERVANDDAFKRALASIPLVSIDGLDVYFPEGDVQKEKDDVIVDYAIAQGLIAPHDLD